MSSISKVVYGNTTVMDITDSTVNTNNLLSGEVAYGANGDRVVGSVTVPSSIDDLSDVTISSPSNGQVLKYNSSSSKWENANESGGGSSVTITTSDSSLYGETLTLSDGTTTLTTTFSNSGEATFSGVTMTGNLTATCGVEVKTISIPYFGNYDIDFDQPTTETVTLTIYSAKEDTISYTDIDGATQTITFASGATSKQVQITIEPSGNSFTFTSSVAKNPDNLSQYYSKTFTITTNTTELYLMPDAVKTLYWWGYNGGVDVANSTTGWTASASGGYSWVLGNLVWNTTNITGSSTSGTKYVSGFASINKIDLSQLTSFKVLLTGHDSNYQRVYTTSKDFMNGYVLQTQTPLSGTDVVQSLDITSINDDAYVGMQMSTGTNVITVKAIWLE